MVDESHGMLPQLKAMHGGDRSRKERLVKHGFWLPSASDNCPLKNEEFWARVLQGVFVLATLFRHELDLIEGVNEPIDMIIRLTYVCDPEIHVRPTKDQLTNLLDEIRLRALRDEKTLLMALTKRDAEDSTAYLYCRAFRPPTSIPVSYPRSVGCSEGSPTWRNRLPRGREPTARRSGSTPSIAGCDS